MSKQILFAGAIALLTSGAHVTAFAATDSKNPVVLEVGAQKFTKNDVAKIIPPENRDKILESNYEQVLEEFSKNELIYGAAVKQGLDKDPAVLDQIESIRKRIIASEYNKRLVDQKVTEAAMKKSYDTDYANKPGPEKVRARHILVSTEDKAKEMITRISKGEDFATLAKEHSTCGSKSNGGDLDYFTRDQMVKPFADAAFALEVGKVTPQPIKTQFGWHVIKLEDKPASTTLPYDQVQSKIKRQLSQEAVDAEAKRLSAETPVKKFKLDGTPLK